MIASTAAILAQALEEPRPAPWVRCHDAQRHGIPLEVTARPGAGCGSMVVQALHTSHGHGAERSGSWCRASLRRCHSGVMRLVAMVATLGLRMALDW